MDPCTNDRILVPEEDLILTLKVYRISKKQSAFGDDLVGTLRAYMFAKRLGLFEDSLSLLALLE